MGRREVGKLIYKATNRRVGMAEGYSSQNALGEKMFLAQY